MVTIIQVEENRTVRCNAIQEKAASVVYTNRRSVFDRCIFGIIVSVFIIMCK